MRLVPVVLALGISCGIFVAQSVSELARLRREALTDKARRLRYVDDDSVVEVPTIPPGEFHLFLSHVWGTGQDHVRNSHQSSRTNTDLTSCAACMLLSLSRRDQGRLICVRACNRPTTHRCGS